MHMWSVNHSCVIRGGTIIIFGFTKLIKPGICKRTQSLYLFLLYYYFYSSTKRNGVICN